MLVGVRNEGSSKKLYEGGRKKRRYIKNQSTKKTGWRSKKPQEGNRVEGEKKIIRGRNALKAPKLKSGSARPGKKITLKAHQVGVTPLYPRRKGTSNRIFMSGRGEKAKEGMPIRRRGGTFPHAGIPTNIGEKVGVWSENGRKESKWCGGTKG